MLSFTSHQSISSVLLLNSASLCQVLVQIFRKYNSHSEQLNTATVMALFVWMM